MPDEQNPRGSDVKEFPSKKTGLGGRTRSTSEVLFSRITYSGRCSKYTCCYSCWNRDCYQQRCNVALQTRRNIFLTKHWTKYLLQQMGMVKRHGSANAKVDVKNFEELKDLFLSDVKSVIEMDEVPPAMVINWDHTEINYVLVSSLTMEKEGSKKVEIVAKTDYRCVWLFNFLPVQLLYQGKATKSLPHFQFPEVARYVNS